MNKDCIFQNDRSQLPSLKGYKVVTLLSSSAIDVQSEEAFVMKDSECMVFLASDQKIALIAL